MKRLCLLSLSSLFCLLGMSVGLSAWGAEQPLVQNSTFESLYEMAIKQNPDIKVLQESLQVSQQDIVIAGYIPNPSLNTYWGWGRMTSVLGNPNQVGLQQTLELGPKRKLRTLDAQLQYDKEKAGLQQALWQLRSHLRLAYLDYLATVSQVEQLEKQYSLVNQLIHIAEVRFKAGSSPQADLIQAQLSQYQLNPVRIHLQGQLVQNQWKLAQWVGLTQRDALHLDGSHSALLEQVPYWKASLAQADYVTCLTKLKQFGRQHRQELKIALQQVEQSRVRLKASKLQRIPDPQVGGGILFVNVLSPLSNINEKDNFLGGYATFNVALPIFHNQGGEIAKSKARLSVDEGNVEALQFAIDSGIQQAVVGIETQQKTLENYRKQLLPQSLQVLQLADLGYRYGKTGLANVILARQAYQAIQVDYIKTLGQAWQSWAALEQQTGLPLEVLVNELPWSQPTQVYQRPNLPTPLEIH